MSKPGYSLNNNFKVCARIKPLEYSSRMLEVANDSVVTIRDINNKTNMEKQLFHFNKVFDQTAKQENVFSYVVDNAVGKALEGTNCCILSYGQTGAGKSFTMFGDDDKISAGNTIHMYSDSQKDKKGLISKTIEFLLKRNKEMEGQRELILTCNFVEVYLDQVRDLSRNYSDRNTIGTTRKRSIGTGVTASSYETENLDIYEHPNGQMLIRDVKNVVIKSLDELYELLASGFALRDKSEAKGNQIWARAHTIFTINIVQKEVENEDLPFPKSMIQFVDLAGSERIAKSITEGQHKFQEAVLIMSHMTSLYKVMAAIASNSKNIPYRDSKLTKILYNCLTPYNSIIMIAHLHPAESNFEETLNTLQYAERCKNIDFKNKHSIGGNPSGLGGMDESAAFTGMSGNASNDKLWKKMTEEINDLKTKIEHTQRDYKSKLERIQTYLGIDIDLDKVTSNTASREYQVLNQLKNANLENQNLKITISQTEELFEAEAKEVEKERKEFLQKQQNMETKNVQLKDTMKKDTEKVKSEKNKDEETLRKKIQQLTDENKKLTEQNTQLLEDKTHALMNFYPNLNSKTRDINQNLDMKNIGKKEAELEFKDEVNQLKTEYKKISDSLKDQYEQHLKTKNEEMERYTLKTQEYQAKQKEQIRGMEDELVRLNDMFQKQEQTIARVEDGGYSNGLKSFFIPTKDKCVLPTRQRFACLYKILDTKKTEVTTKTLYRDREKETEPKETKVAAQEEGAKKTVAPLLASKSQGKFTTTFGNIAHTGISALSKVSEKPDTQEIDFGVNIEKLLEKDLVRYATNIQKLCRKLKDTEKELQEQADKFAELNAYGDIYEVIRERDRYKELYREETKKSNENKVKFETQKRMLKSSPSAGSTQTKFRPGTAGWH